MAGLAGRIQPRVYAARMALRARRGGMFSRQREFGLRSVIEGCWSPARGGVAQDAGLGQTGGGVIWIRGGLVVLQVAGLASGSEARVLVVHVA